MRIAQVPVGMSIAVVGKLIAACSSADQRMLAKLIPRNAPKIGTLAADGPEAGRSGDRRRLNLLELLQLRVRIGDRVTNLDQANDPRSKQKDNKGHYADLPHPQFRCRGAKPVVEDEDEKAAEERQRRG